MNKILFDRNIKGKIKFNYKLWDKFLRRRMYGWDLSRHDKNRVTKLFRSIDGKIITKFKSDTEDKQIEIPEGNEGRSLQVHLKLSSYSNDTDRFLIARQLCSKNPQYKITYSLILPELRNI